MLLLVLNGDKDVALYNFLDEVVLFLFVLLIHPLWKLRLYMVVGILEYYRGFKMLNPLPRVKLECQVTFPTHWRNGIFVNHVLRVRLQKTF